MLGDSGCVLALPDGAGSGVLDAVPGTITTGAGTVASGAGLDPEAVDPALADCILFQPKRPPPAAMRTRTATAIQGRALRFGLGARSAEVFAAVNVPGPVPTNGAVGAPTIGNGFVAPAANGVWMPGVDVPREIWPELDIGTPPAICTNASTSSRTD